MWPILFELPGYELGTFGVLVGIAVLCGLAIARHLGARDGLDPRKVNDLGLAVLIAGFIGAKALGLLVAWFNSAPITWAEIRSAGAVHGGLAAAMITGFFLCRHYRIPIHGLFDAYVPGTALGQAIGRLGCLAAGCCFGSPSDAPWSITFHHTRAAELGGVPLGVSLHPVQLYDALLHLGLFALLFVMHRKNVLKTRLFAVWCLAEGCIRLFVESFRGDLGRGVWFNVESVSTGRMTALTFVFLGLLLLAFQRTRPDLRVTAP